MIYGKWFYRPRSAQIDALDATLDGDYGDLMLRMVGPTSGFMRQGRVRNMPKIALKELRPMTDTFPEGHGLSNSVIEGLVFQSEGECLRRNDGLPTKEAGTTRCIRLSCHSVSYGAKRK